MTNRERVLQLIHTHPGLTDAEIAARTGIRPHQQVNQICRRLAVEGAITRVKGPDDLLINVPVESPARDPASRSSTPGRAKPPALGRPAGEPLASTPVLRTDAPTLVLVQCSKAKSSGGQSDLDGRRIGDLLPRSLRTALTSAREAVAARAHRDERLLMPANSRYTGRLYESAGGLITRPPPGIRPVILSGGYGLLLPEEPIGHYDRKFQVGDWPAGLLEQCLLETTQALKCAQVVALCANTSDYARLVRKTPWEKLGIEVHLGWPDVAGRGGAQRLVPRAIGEALRALAAGGLDESWASSDGVALVWERLA